MSEQRGLHEETRDAVAALVLDALDEGEARPVREHLAECEECASYARWLQAAVDQLPASVPQVEPPKRLGKRLAQLARADAERMRAAEDDKRARGRRSWRGLAWRPATALAAVAVLVAGGVVGWTLHDPEAEPEAITASLSRSGGPATLTVEHAPPLAGDRVYQAWVARGDRMAPSSTFDVSDEGSGTAVIHEPLRGADAVAVTSEPAGGSDEPTSRPLLETPLD